MLNAGETTEVYGEELFEEMKLLVKAITASTLAHLPSPAAA